MLNLDYKKIDTYLELLSVVDEKAVWAICKEPKEDGDEPRPVYGSCPIPKPNDGEALYLVANELRGVRRTNRNVVRCRAAFIDCDRLGVSWEEAREVAPPLMRCGRDKTHVHVYWRLHPGFPLHEFKPLQKRLADHYGSDPSVCNLARIMRVPGSYNWKTGQPVLHDLLEYDESAPALMPSDFKFSKFYRSVRLLSGASEPGRNSEAFKLAALGCDEGLPEADRLAALARWNARNDPPLSPEELETVNRNAETYRQGPSSGGFDEWAYVSAADAFYQVNELRSLPAQAFARELAYLCPRGNAATTACRDRLVRICETTVFEPGSPERLIERPGRLPVLNLYRPGDVRPVPGDTAWFDEHMAYLLPDADERERLIDWLMFVLSHPGRKIRYAVLLQGTTGTGKSWIVELLKAALGPHNVAVPGNDALLGQYNSWAEHALLIAINELMFRGRFDVINRVKTWITDEDWTMRGLYRNPVTMPNRFNIFCTTNHRDAIRLDPNDRRWFVLFSPATARPDAYYRDLFSDLPGKAAALLHRAQTHQYRADFSPDGRAPSTRGRRQICDTSRPEIELWLEDMISAMDPPFDAGKPLTLGEIQAADGFPLYPGADKELKTALVRIGFEQIREQTAGVRTRKWALPSWLQK